MPSKDFTSDIKMPKRRVHFILNVKGFWELQGEKASKPETRPKLNFSLGLLYYMARALNPRMLKAASHRAAVSKMHDRAASDDLPTLTARRKVVLVALDVLVSNATHRALDNRIKEI